MKILLDEMSDGWYDRLRHRGYMVYTVKKLREDGHGLEDDVLVADYAKENGMILVTKDNKLGRSCSVSDIPCILLDDEKLFKILLQKMDEYGSS